VENGKKVCFEIHDYDYSKLKLFFISLLWRASVSSHEFFQGVQVNKFENQLKEMILDNDPGNEDIFSVILARWDDAAIEEGIGLGILSPWRRRFSGINYYSFYFGFGFLATIKVDQRPVPKQFRRGILKPNNPLYIYIFQLSQSKEIEHIQKISEAQKIKDLFCPFQVRKRKS
jgi:hypothetical protein